MQGLHAGCVGLYEGRRNRWWNKSGRIRSLGDDRLSSSRRIFLLSRFLILLFVDTQSFPELLHSRETILDADGHRTLQSVREALREGGNQFGHRLQRVHAT